MDEINADVEIHDRVDKPEDVRAWMIEDDGLKEDDELEGALLCPGCITSYVGNGTVHSVSHQGMMADAFCDECDSFLGDDDE